MQFLVAMASYTPFKVSPTGQAFLNSQDSRFEPILPYKYDVFLSYSSDDSGLAVEIKEGMIGVGLECFMAEQDIGLSTLWSDEIKAAIHESKIAVLLLTPSSINSRWVLAEAGAFWVLGKPMLPATNHANTDKIPSFISAHQCIAIETTSNRHKLYQKTANICQAIIRKKMLSV
jgi:hypothetical protein